MKSFGKKISEQQMASNKKKGKVRKNISKSSKPFACSWFILRILNNSQETSQLLRSATLQTCFFLLIF